MRELNPRSIAPPLARYAHGVLVPDGAQLICTSGQLGMTRDGTVPDGVRDQAEICFANIDEILSDGGSDRSNVIRVNAYVTDRGHMTEYMEARDKWLEGIRRLPASTLMIVSGFTRPEFLVEIEVLAAIVARS
ncbi:MAG: RidA family protein [Boseongicola sp.]